MLQVSKRFVLYITFDLVYTLCLNWGMTSVHNPTIDADRALIQSLGGPTQLARLLKLEKFGSVQRIQNWTVRGIPPAVKLAYPAIFLSDLDASKKPEQAAVVSS